MSCMCNVSKKKHSVHKSEQTVIEVRMCTFMKISSTQISKLIFCFHFCVVPSKTSGTHTNSVDIIKSEIQMKTQASFSSG